jgi:soluble P-type ATPase
MVYDVPGIGSLDLKTVILDVSGTLAVDGRLVDGVKSRIAKLQSLGFHIVFFTDNARNDADGIAEFLDIQWRPAATAADKLHEARALGLEYCVFIGNGRDDLELMKAVKLGIVTLQAEGVAEETFQAGDVVVLTINDALDLMIEPERLIATLRK